eukprot:scaffold1093_cov359-Prasinococcus_capsulatus_cf.AAC.10
MSFALCFFFAGSPSPTLSASAWSTTPRKARSQAADRRRAQGPRGPVRARRRQRPRLGATHPLRAAQGALALLVDPPDGRRVLQRHAEQGLPHGRCRLTAELGPPARLARLALLLRALQQRLLQLRDRFGGRRARPLVAALALCLCVERAAVVVGLQRGELVRGTLGRPQERVAPRGLLARCLHRQLLLRLEELQGRHLLLLYGYVRVCWLCSGGAPGGGGARVQVHQRLLCLPPLLVRQHLVPAGVLRAA